MTGWDSEVELQLGGTVRWICNWMTGWDSEVDLQLDDWVG